MSTITHIPPPRTRDDLHVPRSRDLADVAAIEDSLLHYVRHPISEASVAVCGATGEFDARGTGGPPGRICPLCGLVYAAMKA
ncbi:hypothetical protein TPB0596_12290 [Tsukamurella pulmonis]|uniref:hypothetical protein n=1 Tax=Tsukamurella pulmonis TaxID=47312 RepID=UPI001EDD4B35|nr:hypothetical protein [Tsukamurella pulmonis]BDD81466.1 hypothetical protein TPB0596_12290 [Tsukamurella pulmonis]